jgi:hypothetical protein
MVKISKNDGRNGDSGSPMSKEVQGTKVFLNKGGILFAEYLEKGATIMAK